MNWIFLKQGTKFSSEYVNILVYRLALTTPGIDRFICYTDDPAGIVNAVETRPLWPTENPVTGWWWKLAILAKHEPGDNRYIDLDMLIVGDMSGFYPGPDQLKLINNRNVNINSSIMAWQEPIDSPWQDFLARQNFHETQPHPYGDQELLLAARDRGELRWDTFDSKTVAWLGRTTRGEQPCANFSTETRTIVCKGDRKPHTNRANPYVQQYWSRP